MTDSRARRGRARGSKLKIVAVVLLTPLVLLLGAAAVAYWLWSSEPAYVADRRGFLQSHSDDELASIATSFENRLSRELTRLGANGGSGATQPATSQRGGRDAGPSGGVDTHANRGAGASFAELQDAAQRTETRRVTMDLDELNAWMATKGPQWLANQAIDVPPQVTEPMFAVEGGKPVLGFRFSEGEFSKWVTLVFDANVTPSGQASLRVAEVRGGRLPMPVKTAVDRLDDTARERLGQEKLDELRRAVDGRQFDAKFRLDERVGTVTGFDVRESGFVATLRLEPISAENQRAANALPRL